MQFSSLGSGSKGNATLIRHNNCLLLVDCGFSVRETEKRLARLGIQADQLDALLVTHEHTDHIAGIGPLARRYDLPVYMTAGTWRAKDIGQVPHLKLIKNYAPFSVKSVEVTPVAVPHDASEPAQFVFKTPDYTLGLLTDLGSITPHVEACYSACDALILEANHDPLMLASGPYPQSLKQRVGGAWGHLSNQQALRFLTQIEYERLQYLVVAHISEQNNSLDIAKKALGPVTDSLANVIYACQQEGFDWIDLKTASVEYSL